MEHVELKESMEQITESIRKQGRELDLMLQRMMLDDLKDINKRLKRIEDRWDERDRKSISPKLAVEKKLTTMDKVKRFIKWLDIKGFLFAVGIVALLTIYIRLVSHL